jgi:Domain of unknown function (DUF4157)
MQTCAQKQNQSQKPVSSSLARPKKATPGPNHREHPILYLQRIIGNQAVQRMLQTHAEECETGLTGPASPRFGHDFSRIPVHSPVAGAIQTKLAINQPGDEYEQEADRVSEQVMRMPEPPTPQAGPDGAGCPECRAEPPRQERARLQAKQTGPNDTGQAKAPPIVHEVLRSPGQPLDTATRAFMEPRFGHDFSRVRVHSDAAAEQSARDVNAGAYTVGQNIVFGAGRFAPGTQEGRRLIAHELTHVVQQNGGTVSRTSLEQGELRMKKSPLASTQPGSTHVSYRPIVQRFPVYREGSSTLPNLTPKAKDATEDPQRGLSTFEDPLRATINIDKAAIIETDSLHTTALEAVRNGTGPNDTHVSIRPPNDESRAKLLAWVEAGPESELTHQVLTAVIGTWRKPKEKKPEKKEK